MLSSTGRTLAAILLCSAFAVAQTGKPGTGSPGTGSPSSGPSTPSPNVPTTPTTPNRTIPPLQQPQQPPTPIFLTGRVTMEDGTVPPDRVSIEKVCNGNREREGYTDSRGNFSITIGDRNTVFQDASIGSASDPGSSPFGSQFPGNSSMGPGGMAGDRLFGCELQASMPGTISEVIELSGRREMSDPNVGTIVLHRIGKVEGTSISVTTLAAPKAAKKAFQHGRKEAKKNQMDKAKADFLRAVESYPKFAEAWSDLGELYLREHDYKDAVDASQKAIAADSRLISPYFTLVLIAANQENWAATAAYSDKLLALDAYNYPAAYYYNALANLRLQNLDKAVASIQSAQKYDVRASLPKIALLMGMIKEQRSDYAGAVQAYRAFLQKEPQGPASEFARQQLGQAEVKLAAAAPATAAPKPH